MQKRDNYFTSTCRKYKLYDDLPICTFRDPNPWWSKTRTSNRRNKLPLVVLSPGCQVVFRCQGYQDTLGMCKQICLKSEANGPLNLQVRCSHKGSFRRLKLKSRISDWRLSHIFLKRLVGILLNSRLMKCISFDMQVLRTLSAPQSLRFPPAPLRKQCGDSTGLQWKEDKEKFRT